MRSLHLLKRIANAPPVLNFPMIAAPFTFERLILRDMGRETANLHLATSDKRTEVLRDLTRRKRLARQPGTGHVKGNRTGLGELPVIAIGGPKLNPGAAADQAPRQDPDKLADQREEGRPLK